MATATFKDFREVLAKAGYTIEAGSYWYVHTLTRRDHKGTLLLHVFSNETGRPMADDSPAKSVLFTIELAVPKTLDATAPFSVKQAVVPVGDSPSTKFNWADPVFTPHVGNTVSFEAHIPRMREMTCKDLVTRVNNVWDAVEGYVKQTGAKFEPIARFDATRMKDADKRIVSYADRESLQRLANYWGWDYKKGWGGSSPGWTFPMDIDGKTIWVREFSAQHPTIGTRFSIQRTLNTELADVNGWLNTNRGSFPWANFYMGATKSQLGITADINLTPTTTAADIKHEILSFVENVDKLAREQGWKVEKSGI